MIESHTGLRLTTLLCYVTLCNHLLELLVDFLEHSMSLEPLQSVTGTGVHGLNPSHGENRRK